LLTLSRVPVTQPARALWEQRDLPEPPPYSFRNLLKIIGPGVILLSSSTGGGEWLVGPTMAVKFGVQFFWVAMVAIVLQVVFNLEGLRYTLYTGEPVYCGFLRLKPGPAFWTGYYCFVSLMALGWPSLAVSSASSLFAGCAGRLAGGADATVIHWVADGLILTTLLLLLFGGTIEKMLERLSYFMMGFVFLFLLAVNLIFIPLPHWWVTLKGFFQFTAFTANMDWTLMAALAATAGSGGMGNLVVTSWARDKGLGMARYTGAIPSAVGGRELKLSPEGKIFPITPDNLRRWKTWFRYVQVDQIYLWGFLAFVGMFLNVNLATGVIPPGTDLTGMATGTYQAKYMADRLWTGLWFLTLLNGFWILYSTQLGNTDILIRTMTDLLWSGWPRVRRWQAQNIARLYYSLLIPFTLLAMLAVRVAPPDKLFKAQACVSGFIMIIASAQILLVNRRYLPREIRSSRRELALAGCGLFYLFFTTKVTLDVLKS
jgi:Mn2+/Fe2+ NRAMP family transporter